VTSIGWYEALDVAAAADEVARACAGRPPILYGQSMGAVAILRAASQGLVHPSAVVLEAPYDRLRITVGNRFRLMGLPAFPLADLLVFWGGVQLGFNAFALNPCDYAPALRCPALVIRGGKDRRVTAAELDRVAGRLGGPVTRVELPGASHEDWSLAAMRVREEALGPWLRSLAGRRP
jgi:hypothetical protein